MAQEMDAARPVRELYSALNSQDLAAFDRIVSDSVEYVDFALGETFHGREAFKNYFKNWWTAFPKGSGEIRNMIASNDQIVVEVLGRGDQTGAFETKHRQVAPTNQVFEFHFCQVFRVRGGMIVGGHSYSDAFKLLEGRSELREAA